MEDQKQRVYDALNKMGIKYEVVEHEPVHTMEDMDRLGLPEKGTLCKNLFLRDSKGKRHFLITADEKTKVDLKTLGRQLGAGNLDSKSGKVVAEEFRKINEELGKTLLMVTHDPQMASRCKRVIFLKDGYVMNDVRKEGTEEEFYRTIIGEMEKF